MRNEDPWTTGEQNEKGGLAGGKVGNVKYPTLNRSQAPKIARPNNATIRNSRKQSSPLLWLGKP